MTQYSIIRACQAQAQHPLIADLPAYIYALVAVFAAAKARGYPLRMVLTGNWKGGEWNAKMPSKKGWNKSNPTLEECVAHVMLSLEDGLPRLLGVVPASIECIIADTDEGNPAALLKARPPIGYTESFSGRGVHAYYPAPADARDMKGQVVDTADGALIIDVIHRQPYVLIRGDMMGVFASIISAPRTPGEKEFPSDLFPDTLRNTTPIDAVKTQRQWNVHRRIDLTQVGEHKRESALVDVLSRDGQIGRALYRAGKIKTAADMLVFAVPLNEELCVPLGDDALAAAVAQAWSYLRVDPPRGRNEAVMKRTIRWGIRRIRKYWNGGEESVFHAEVLAYVRQCNDVMFMARGMDDCECEELAGKCARWLWKRITQAGLSDAQAKRGRIGGKAKGAAYAGKRKRADELRGKLSPREIGRELGVTKRTVNRWFGTHVGASR